MESGMDVLAQLDYASRVRRKFLNKMKEIPWEEVTRNREVSYYSMKNVMLHMIDNEDWIVNWVIQGRSNEYKRRKWEEYEDIASIERHLEDVEERASICISGLDTDGMRRKVALILGSGERFDLTVEECLFQTFTEQLYHMGELIALLWQQNIEPPRMQWFYNKQKTND